MLKKRYLIIVLVVFLSCNFFLASCAYNPVNESGQLQFRSNNSHSADAILTPDAPLLVVIDAGHGGEDPGCVDNGLNEKDIVLDIALQLRDFLQEDDIETFMIREKDEFVNLEERIKTANEKKAALFISIHCDWFSDRSVGGTQTLYYPSKSLKKGNLVEIEYARIIQEELMKALETKDRGINDRSDLAVLRFAKMPSVIVELAFLSNENDVALLKDSAFRTKTAKALSEGIKRSLAKIKE